jgi:N-acetylated-alpha-linked acidic dipeptidase
MTASRLRFRVLLSLLLAASLSAAPTASPRADAAPEKAPQPLLGFRTAGASAEYALEARYDSLLHRDDLRAWMKRLSARPHHVGSPYGKQNAEFLAGLFRTWGYDTAIERFDVLFPTPKKRSLEMVAPTRFTAALREPKLSADATSGQSSEQLPTFNVYSIDGDVTGELVYVYYGRPRDYDELERRGIDVRGKIVLARYGSTWRGIKPKVAAEHGAIGCIIYSDPREDGTFQGDAYPKGGWRNADAVQRGSVGDMTLYPGDPLTPGVGATAEARRLDRSEAKTLTKIPVLPISAADALPLFRALSGPMAPQEWRGALAVPYHLGPGPAKVHLQLQFDWKLVPAYDVVARLTGRQRPDEWIVRGNHHDAWVNGATDPISGLVALLAEARAVGELARAGSAPQRTLIYCAWDGEEPGLLGSTEWVETHADELKAKCVAYLNSDSNSRGFLDVAGSHTLEPLVNQAARDVPDPEKGTSVLERARAAQILDGTADERKEARARTDLRIGALGSGSDFTPFLQHLGISAVNLGFGGEEQYGQYHSIYDSFDHYTRFGDPSFEYGIALARTAGRLSLRLANAEVLPFAFETMGETVERYSKEVVKLADDMRDEADERNRRLDAGTYTNYDDPTETWLPPRRLDPVPYLNFAPLQNAVVRLNESAKAYEAARRDRMAGAEPIPEAARGELDMALVQCERSLTREQGLPRRPWFEHQVYAPGFYTGYGVKTLPGVREAIEQRDWKEAEEQIGVVAGVLLQYAENIDRAAALLRPIATASR